MKILALVVALLLLPACHAPVTVTTPQGRAAYAADQTVTRLGALQNAVIDAATANKVTTADARLIVSWISGDKTTTPPTVGVLDLLNATPSGWRAAAAIGWPRVRALLEASPSLAVWAPVVDQLLTEVP